jgi:hypothetical protein
VDEGSGGSRLAPLYRVFHAPLHPVHLGVPNTSSKCSNRTSTVFAQSVKLTVGFLRQFSLDRTIDARRLVRFQFSDVFLQPQSPSLAE